MAFKFKRNNDGTSGHTIDCVEDYKLFDRVAGATLVKKYSSGDMMKIAYNSAPKEPIVGSDGLYSARLTLIDLKENHPSAWAAHKLIGLANRSSILKESGTSREGARWSRYTPFGLYTYKLKYGINYMQWSVSEENHGALSVFLGKAMSNYRGAGFECELEKNSKSKGIVKDVIDCRVGRVSAPFTTDEEMQDLAALLYGGGSPNKNSVKTRLPNFQGSEVVKTYIKEHTQAVGDMYIQCNSLQPQFRDITAGVAILDPVDWDNIPPVASFLTKSEQQYINLPSARTYNHITEF
jgi:hypothetical protein